MNITPKYSPTSDGSGRTILSKAKARLVAGGDHQDRNIYSRMDITSPTCSITGLFASWTVFWRDIHMRRYDSRDLFWCEVSYMPSHTPLFVMLVSSNMIAGSAVSLISLMARLAVI